MKTGKGSFKELIRQTAMLLLGSVIYAVAIGLFLDPNNLAPGGVTGVAIILNSLTGFETGTLLIIMNVPLMLLGIWKFGFKFCVTTILTVLLSSLIVNWLSPIGALTSSPLPAAVAGGVLMGIGMGIIFRERATTGGADIVVRLLKLKFKHLRTGALMLMTDLVVILASAIVFKNIEVAIYAAIADFILTKAFDLVLYGGDGARQVIVISQYSDAISGRLMREMEVGVTLLKGEGAYTGTDKNVILCVMRKQMLPQAQDIIKQEDEQAFLVVGSVNEVFGEGFKSHHEERL